MKVLLVHNHYRDTFIGGEDIVYNRELKLLKSILGNESVFSYSRQNSGAKTIEIAKSILFSFKTYFEVKAIIKENGIDIVHVHNFFPLISMSVFLAARRQGVKNILTLHNFRPWCIAGTFYLEGKGICEKCSKKIIPIHGILNKCFRKSMLQSLIAQVAFSFYKIFSFFNWIDFFLVLTPFQKDKVLDLGIESKKILLRPNFVEDKKIIKKERSGYVFIGRPHEEKGLELILKQWQSFPEKLTVIGEMQGKEDLIKKYKNENIIFVGRRNQGEISEYLSSAKYLIQSSVWYETFGLTIIEAFRSSTPVIGFNIGTRRDFISNRVNGFLCEPKRLNETLAESRDFENYDELSKNARLTFLDYSEDNAKNETIYLYNKILGEIS